MTYNLYKPELRLSFVLLYSAYLLELAVVQHNIQCDLHEIEDEKIYLCILPGDRLQI